MTTEKNILVEVKALELRLKELELERSRFSEGDPALVATRTQNWITLLALMVALIGIPTAYNIIRYDQLWDQVNEEISQSGAARIELNERLLEFVASAEERTSANSRQFQIQIDNRQQRQEADLRQSLQELEERVDRAIGIDSGERTLVIEYLADAIDDEVGRPLEWRGDYYCSQRVFFDVKNETDFFTEILVEQMLFPYPFAYRLPVWPSPGFFDHSFNDLQDHDNRFIPGFGRTSWSDTIDVSEEHSNSVLDYINNSIEVPEFEFQVHYANTGGTTKVARSKFRPVLHEDFVECLRLLAVGWRPEPDVSPVFERID